MTPDALDVLLWLHILSSVGLLLGCLIAARQAAKLRKKYKAAQKTDDSIIWNQMRMIRSLYQRLSAYEIVDGEFEEFLQTEELFHRYREDLAKSSNKVR